MNLSEEMAQEVHDSWSRWMKYVFSKGRRCNKGGFYSFTEHMFIPEGAHILFPEDVDRWYRQMDTEYAMLSEEEQESYRKEVDYLLLLFVHYMDEWMEEHIEEGLDRGEILDEWTRTRNALLSERGLPT